LIVAGNDREERRILAKVDGFWKLSTNALEKSVKRGADNCEVGGGGTSATGPVDGKRFHGV